MDDKKQMLARALEAAEKKAVEAGPGPYCIACQNADPDREKGEKIRCTRYSRWVELFETCDTFQWRLYGNRKELPSYELLVEKTANCELLKKGAEKYA